MRILLVLEGHLTIRIPFGCRSKLGFPFRYLIESQQQLGILNMALFLNT